MTCEYQNSSGECTSKYCDLPPNKNIRTNAKRIADFKQRQYCHGDNTRCPYYPANNTGKNKMSQTDKNISIKNAYNRDKENLSKPMSAGDWIIAIIMIFIIYNIFKFIMQ